MKNKTLTKSKVKKNKLSGPITLGDLQTLQDQKGVAVVQVPQKLEIFGKTAARYKVAYGGRGGGKSRAFAGMLIMMSLQKKMRILCTREIQRSIEHSVHKILKDEIFRLKLQKYFKITADGITNIYGSEFLFKGLRSDIQQIKSLEGIDICWVEEAAKVSRNSWKELIPTIRNEGSEIWVSFNPDDEEDETFKRFIKETPEKWKFNEITRKIQRYFVQVNINYYDNPWFTGTLRQEMEEDKRKDESVYENIWLGHCKTISEAQIFKGRYRVEAFETLPLSKVEGNIYYQGADFGFSKDPATMVRCYIWKGKLYVDYAVGDTRIEMNHLTRDLYSEVPNFRDFSIYADCSRPETISFLQKTDKLDIAGAKKWPGSVEDGISYLKTFDEIVIHPRCEGLIKEMKYYSYKVDRVTGKILRVPVDAWNHYIDALRYALFELIKENDENLNYRGIRGESAKMRN